ncbi:hypothetical protein EW145_g1544 [Phellinidium pouzarii]|uniref:Uncharacterized protein n=1 Tax=Phellinidium pouzarii TaxID=167371 RepID=A0A4S4LEF6_9AGAM|nr:hypothetical protein EW145_g1544 [Phellinidium pouzarii]
MSSAAQTVEVATHLWPRPDTLVARREAAKFYALAAFVEKVWRRKFTGLTVLWFLNRWVFFLAVIPTIVSFHDPQWIGPVCVPARLIFCDRYFRYPGFIAAFQRVVIGSVFILRIYCIYGRSIRAPSIIVAFLIPEIVVKLFVTIKWDSVVLILTVSRSYVAYQQSVMVNTASRLWKVILKDGIVYFLVIFSANLLTVIMFGLDLKAINADFGVMINSLMTARLILNLKSVGSFERNGAESTSIGGDAGGATVMSAWEAAVLGDIGNDFEESSEMSSRTAVSTIASSRLLKDSVELGQVEEYELLQRTGGETPDNLGSTQPPSWVIE